MPAIKAPSFLIRSRPSSPAPTRQEVKGGDADASVASRRTMTRLQNPFKRSPSASPAPSNRTPIGSMTPIESATPVAGVGAQYLDSIGLKFAEAVSKALANPIGPPIPNSSNPSNSGVSPVVNGSDPCAQILKGRRPFPPGRGAALGALITSELSRGAGDAHLTRAIIRTLQKPLSVLLNNLSNMLMPLLPYVTGAGFGTDKGIAGISVPSPVAQSHALALAALAAELLESLNAIHRTGIAGGTGVGGGVDYLRGIRTSLANLIQRVVSPLIGGVKSELEPILDLLATAPLPRQDVDKAGSSVVPATPTGVIALAAAIPSVTTKLARYTTVPGEVSESAHAALLIALVWRGLVALSSRPLLDPFVTPLSVQDSKKGGSREGLKEPSKDAAGKEKTTPPGLKVKKELPFVTALTQIASGSSTRSTVSTPLASSTSSLAPPPSAGSKSVNSTTTPPTTPRFSRIPLPLASRPPSPSGSHATSSKSKSSPPPGPLSPIETLLVDTIAVFNLLSTLCKPKAGGLALEAVDEAFEALAGFRDMLKFLVEELSLAASEKNALLASPSLSLARVTELLIKKSEEVPVLVALNVLLQLVPRCQLPLPDESAVLSSTNTHLPANTILSLSSPRTISVPRLLNLPADKYYEGCLTTFGRAEDSADTIGGAVLDSFAVRPLPSLLVPSARGLDVRVLQAWLTESIDDDDDESEEEDARSALAVQNQMNGLSLSPSVSNTSDVSATSSFHISA